jgi:hypothetical protein
VYSLTGPYQQTSRRIPLLWPLIGREIDRLGTQMQQVVVARAKSAAPPPGGASAAPNVAAPPVDRLQLSPASVDQQWANDIDEAQHIGSAMADGLQLPGPAVQIRIFYTTTGVPAPTADSQPNPIGPKPVQVADTGWVAYLPEANR